MISDYYEHIRKVKQEKLFNEIVKIVVIHKSVDEGSFKRTRLFFFQPY